MGQSAMVPSQGNRFVSPRYPCVGLTQRRVWLHGKKDTKKNALCQGVIEVAEVIKVIPNALPAPTPLLSLAKMNMYQNQSPSQYLAQV